ncbi:MAG: hypothetical protein ACRCX8_14340 [Sarcina sp.]
MKGRKVNEDCLELGKNYVVVQSGVNWAEREKEEVCMFKIKNGVLGLWFDESCYHVKKDGFDGFEIDIYEYIKEEIEVEDFVKVLKLWLENGECSKFSCENCPLGEQNCNMIKDIMLTSNKMVFSKQKYIDCMIERYRNEPYKLATFITVDWAVKCEGKTLEECKKIGYKVDESWFVEVK